MVGDGFTGNEVLHNSMRECKTFIDWDSMGNTVSRINDATGGSTAGIEGKDGLVSKVHTVDSESLEHDLGHLLSVSFWVRWGLSQVNIVLFGIDFELAN